MLKKTKIVCTLGPSSNTPEIIEKMIQAGMNVARFNFSHGSHAEHKQRIDMVRAASRKLGIPVALLLDTKGPEIRLGKFKNGSIMMEAGNDFILTARDVDGDETIASMNYKELPRDVKAGDHILLSDGLVNLEVVSVEGEDIHTKILNSGKMSNRKRVAVPGIAINLPAVSESDADDIEFGCRMNMDWIAASFIQRGKDVLTIRKILEKHGSHMKIVSKIECQTAVNNIDDIIKMSDGIMVARGDLGVEVPAEEVPMLQKVLIHKCQTAGKPVITATQMLESMCNYPRPTRAETSDVANAIFDGTDAIMLSGETAAGQYPIEAVETMVRIASYIEQHQMGNDGYRIQQEALRHSAARTVANAVSYSCCQMAHDLNAAAIITPSNSGTTARMVARFRPPCPVIAPTPSEKAYHQLGLSYGVVPARMSMSGDTDSLINEAVLAAEEGGFVHPGDIAIISAGVPTGVSGTTNLIKAHIVGNVLLRGIGIGDSCASGSACIVNTLSDLESAFKPGNIIVTKMTTTEMLPYIRQAAGVIVESTDQQCHAAISCQALGIPLFMDRTEQAVHMLKNGMTVTVDAKEGFLYNGIKE
ncbi:MAG TPA: pyruvate kinase [Megasphaera sp.]|nr:pyruvate kinase [Megasphaera sp.]